MYGLAVTAALSLVHPVARFRLYVVPVFLVAAGAYLAMAGTALRTRAWRHVAALLLLALVGALAQRAATRQDAIATPRPIDYTIARRLAAQADDVDLLRRMAEDAERHDPRNPSYFAILGQHLARRGEIEDAIRCYERALERQHVDAIRKDLEELRARAR